MQGLGQVCNSNSSSWCIFRAIWLAGEKVLYFAKFHEQESSNYFPSANSNSNVKENTILMTKLEL